MELPAAVSAFAARLAVLGWVPDLLVAGSLATGDYVPGVSDLDLVAVVDGPIDAVRLEQLVALHRELDRGPARGADLGCVYLAEDAIAGPASTQPTTTHPTTTHPTTTHPTTTHPTWTHGRLVHRILSGISRAELVRHGFAVYGRAPGVLLPPMTDDDVRSAAKAELGGYWRWAARRPWMWLDPTIADLGLTSMARGRFALDTGRLLTKSEAVEQARAPGWLIDQLRGRRRGEPVPSPRLRIGWIAWTDARRTVRLARRSASD